MGSNIAHECGSRATPTTFQSGTPRDKGSTDEQKDQNAVAGKAPQNIKLPFEQSVGYQARLTHRLIQRLLHQKIAPYGVTPGMWYFLRALWHKDGQTQRELSLLVGTMEPTTLSAIRTMEASGLVQRKRNDEDRRKINVFLTGRGRELENILMPLAKEVVDASVEGFSINERGLLLQYLKSIQNNILKHLDEDVHLG